MTDVEFCQGNGVASLWKDAILKLYGSYFVYLALRESQTKKRYVCQREHHKVIIHFTYRRLWLVGACAYNGKLQASMRFAYEWSTTPKI